tara:strand:- start:1941 stop:2621 length:681 start_codon:yes stop_codon:yes gene_type:complete
MKNNNIKEEISRIKELFSDDNLYGNLITESCACSDGDMIDELKDDYIIVKKSSSSTCESKIDDIPWLKCVKDGLNAAGKSFNVFEQDGACSIYYDAKGKEFNLSGIEDWSPTKGGMHKQALLQFWEDGTFKGEDNTFAILVEWMGAIPNKTTYKYVTDGDEKFLHIAFPMMKKITLRGTVDNNCKIKKVYITEIVNERNKKFKKMIHLDHYDGKDLVDEIIKNTFK